MSEPYYQDEHVTLWHGDCLDVLADLPDASVDAVVTDPPYNLSTSAKRDKKCLREVVSEILLPRDEHDDTERGEGVHLATPALRGADLRGEDWAVRVDAGVGVPEGAVHFEHPTVVQDEVGAGDEPAALATDGDLPLEGDSLSFEFGGDLILQSADDWDATFCNGTCRCFTEPSPGFIAVSVVVPRLAGGNRSGVRLVVEGRDANVGVRHDAGRQAECPTGVHAGGGAEDRAVLRLDLRGGTGELDLTDRTLDNLTPFQLARAEGIGAGAGAGRLSPVAQPYRVRVVDGTAGRAFTLHHVAHVLNSSTGGFMGREWDGWENPAAFQRWCTAWTAECLRVLKPGGHLLAFGGTRTWHRLACAVEDAGFEVRDSIAWMYGSGFPKSLDVSKAIDKRRHDGADIRRVTAWVAATRTAAGVTNRDIDAAFGFNGMAGHWTTQGPQAAIPTLDHTPALLAVLGISVEDVPDEIRALLIDLNGMKGQPGPAWFAREITQAEARPLVSGETISFDQRSSKERERRDIPATPDAERWQGWGTALKPAFEPVVVARKPLIGTVAATVLAHGTGALNIAACRISASEQSPEWPTSQGSAGSSRGDSTTCTCPELADDQTIHSPSTPLPASSEPSPARRNDPLASAQSDGLDSSPLPDSQGDYRSSCRSGGAPAPLAGVADRASAPQPLDAPEPDAHSRAGSRIPTSQSMPCPKCTAPNVERRRDTLVRPAIRRDDNTVLGKGLGAGTQVEPSGRWPTNVALDSTQAAALDEMSGESASRVGKPRGSDAGDGWGMTATGAEYADSGGPSRFFFVAKADSDERPRVNGVAHPTVKPLDLMRWLVRLVTPPGGVVVDPFAGSGTTVEACILEGLHCLAIERESDYLPLIVSRIHRRRDPVEAIKITGDDMGLFAHLEGEGA